MSERRPPEYDKHGPGKKIVPSKDLVPIKSTNGSDGKVPVRESRNPIASFLALTQQFDEQVERFQNLYSAWDERNRRVDLYREGANINYVQDWWQQTREGAEQCAAELEQLSEANKDLMANPEEDMYHPSVQYLKSRIAVMVKALPEAKLSDPKGYALLLAQRLEVEGLNVMVWESIFHELRDTRKKPPVIADVLSLLNQHKTKWQRRLTAINLDKIQQWGEETTFTLEFKHAVFKHALLEYLDNHGYAKLAVEVREDYSFPWYVAIQATAMAEGLFELAAKMEGNVFEASDPFEEARRILTDKKHVTLEWDLLLKTAQRWLNSNKPSVCTKCAVGYVTEELPWRCLACDSHDSIVDYAIWEQQVASEQQTLEVELQYWRRQHKLREKSARLNKKAPAWWYEKRKERRLQEWKRRMEEDRWNQIALSNEKAKEHDEYIAQCREERRLQEEAEAEVWALFEPYLRTRRKAHGIVDDAAE